MTPSARVAWFERAKAGPVPASHPTRGAEAVSDKQIVLVGDLHGNLGKSFKDFLTKVPQDAFVIQVGDFGLWPFDREINFPRPVYFIEGNHEHFPSLLRLNGGTLQGDVPVEIQPNLFFCPRGSVLEAHGWKIGFLGGADSIDFKYRKNGVDIWLEEEISELDVKRWVDNGPYDMVITHTPPQGFIDKNFDPRGPLGFGLEYGWKGTSAPRLEKGWDKLGQPPLFCGHMHSKRDDGLVRVLDIGEILTIFGK